METGGETYVTRYTFIQRLNNSANTVDWETFNFYYGSFIKNIIRRMRVNPQDSEDLLQEVLLKVWKNLNKFEPNQQKGAFRAWINTTTRNTVYSFFRKQGSEDRKRSAAEYLSSINKLENPEEAYVEEEWKKHITTLAFNKIAKKVSAEHLQIFCDFAEGDTVAYLSTKFDLPEHKIYRYKKRVEILLAQEIKALKDFLE